ncbi:hypothetical protein [Flavobacterium sp.]|uniref:hypothetical protein n=1 Tax=Flavobacterium sp. TaxID=239 RepID=UPI003D6A1B5A
MAVLAIPNPKKSTQVDFSIERVKLSVLNISLINDKYKFTASNEIFNQYTYEALEFLSLGVYIDINLNRLGENKTEISVEVRRKLGTFNQSHEVTKANEHLMKIFDCIAKLTAKSPDEIENMKPIKNEKPVNNSNSFSKNNKTTDSWYEKTWLVVLLCILFFPVGLYALWKNSSIAKGFKIGVTVIIALILISNIREKDSKISNQPEKQSVTKELNSNPVSGNEEESLNAEKEIVLEKLKVKAKRDWPDDFTTQEFWINQQIEDYEYMLSIENNSIKSKAQKNWPLDFTTQKFWYGEQIEAQERMK